jgi:hypothetical protein
MPLFCGEDLNSGAFSKYFSPGWRLGLVVTFFSLINLHENARHSEIGMSQNVIIIAFSTK